MAEGLTRWVFWVNGGLVLAWMALRLAKQKQAERCACHVLRSLGSVATPFDFKKVQCFTVIESVETWRRLRR